MESHCHWGRLHFPLLKVIRGKVKCGASNNWKCMMTFFFTIAYKINVIAFIRRSAMASPGKPFFFFLYAHAHIPDISIMPHFLHNSVIFMSRCSKQQFMSQPYCAFFRVAKAKELSDSNTSQQVIWPRQSDLENWVGERFSTCVAVQRVTYSQMNLSLIGLPSSLSISIVWMY